MSSTLKKLITNIIENSIADKYEDAIGEWDIKRLSFQEDGTCLCGQKHIKQMCFMENRLNGNQVEVGANCANKISSVDAEAIFTSIERVRKDDHKLPSQLHLDFAYKTQKCITEWEYDFVNDIKQRIKRAKNANKKYELSEKQLKRIRAINWKIYYHNNPKSKYEEL